MTPEQILSHPPLVLSQHQRESYFANGFLCVERLIPPNLIGRVHAAMTALVNRSRSLTKSDDDFVLEPGHGTSAPRLRRLNRATDQDGVFWEMASASILVDAVADVVGPDVKFREAYVNFKWAKGGDAVKWHQDLPFFPHTNLSLVTTLTYLEDCALEQGPLMVVPKSHKGPIFDHYDKSGNWAASISDDDIKAVPVDTAVPLTGAAGSVILMDSRTIHGSKRNALNKSRPLLINGYSSADSFKYFRQAPSMSSKFEGQIVRGEAAKYAHHDPMRLKMPPDWSGGYTSIFEDQKQESRSEHRTP